MHKISQAVHNRCANKIVNILRDVSARCLESNISSNFVGMDSEVWSMSRALQLKSTVNFEMLPHPMQCDSTDAEKDVRVNKNPSEPEEV